MRDMQELREQLDRNRKEIHHRQMTSGSRIKNPNDCVAVDWGKVLGMSGKVYPTDIDGMLERNGHFLFMEWKRPGVKIPQGQDIAYKKLAALPNMKVLYIWGSYDTWQITHLLDVGKGEKLGATNETFRQYLRDWWRYASARRGQ